MTTNTLHLNILAPNRPEDQARRACERLSESILEYQAAVTLYKETHFEYIASVGYMLGYWNSPYSWHMSGTSIWLATKHNSMFINRGWRFPTQFRVKIAGIYFSRSDFQFEIMFHRYGSRNRLLKTKHHFEPHLFFAMAEHATRLGLNHA